MSEIKKVGIEIINSNNSVGEHQENQSDPPTIQVSEYTKSFHKLLPVKNDNKEKTEENTDWFALARKLRQDNRQIIKTLVEKEEELALVQEQLQEQITKNKSAEILINQQEEELNSAQEQINRLLQELKETQKQLLYKQKEEEKLIIQLNQSQKEIENLQLQKAKLTENYEKSSEKNEILTDKIQELELRLQREQRHNLQFKAALNQCLDSPEPIEPIKISEKQPVSNPLISPKSPIPKPVGIKPWSEILEAEEILLENRANNEMEITEENLTSKEQFIPQLKVLNENITPPIPETKSSPSPLINNNYYRKKAKEKRPIMLPQFPKLNLNNES